MSRRPFAPSRLGFAPSTPMVWSSYDTNWEFEIDPSILDRPIGLVKDIAMPERNHERVLDTIGAKYAPVDKLEVALRTMSSKIALQEKMMQAELRAKVEASNLTPQQKTRILAEAQSLIARGPGQAEQIPPDASARILPDDDAEVEPEPEEAAAAAAAPRRPAAAPSRPIVKQSARPPKKSAAAAAAAVFSPVVEGLPAEEVVGVLEAVETAPATTRQGGAADEEEEGDDEIDMADYIMAEEEGDDDQQEEDNWQEYLNTRKADADGDGGDANGNVSDDYDDDY